MSEKLMEALINKDFDLILEDLNGLEFMLAGMDVNTPYWIHLRALITHLFNKKTATLETINCGRITTKIFIGAMGLHEFINQDNIKVISVSHTYRHNILNFLVTYEVTDGTN